MVLVHWPPPASSAHCAITSYAVEYRQEGLRILLSQKILFDVPKRLSTSSSFPFLPPTDSFLWQQAASCREECVQIDNLIPGGHYQFRVRASNRWGVGPPSQPSNMVTLGSCSKKHQLIHSMFF